MLTEKMSHRSTVVIGYGNPSRGDDAVGPLMIERLERKRESGELPPLFDTVTDFQLQIEHAMDLLDRQLILFVDASVSATPPFGFQQLTPQRDESYSSHAMTPSAVLEVFTQVNGFPPPPTFLLTIPGRSFELGSDMTPECEDHLSEALELAAELLGNPSPAVWRAHCR
ncbi:MAG: hydrogenase maturation protease [Sedimenticola sp.]